MKRILEILAQRAGTDFSNYKSATIERRLKKRLSTLGINSIDEYTKLLEKDPEEAEEMFKAILIGVTRFFRDPDSFAALELKIEEIINLKKNAGDLRVWVPACSTGEEAFSVAILINRLLQNRRKQLRIQIFASDIDERALSKARKGIYSEAALEYVPAEIRDEYFVKNGDTFTDKLELPTTNGELKNYALNATPVTIEQGVVTGVSVAMLDITNLSTALKEMREKDLLINSVFNVAAVGLCVTDENAVFIDCNQKFLDIYGYRRDEIVGQSIAVLVPEENAREVIQINRDYIQGKGTSSHSNFKVLKKDGTEIIIESAQRVFEKQNGNRYLVTSVRDVTQAVEARNIEVKSKELLQWSERISKSGSWEYEHRTGVVRFSSGLVELLELDFLTSRKGLEAILNFTREDLRAKDRKALSKAIKAGSEFDFETQVVNAGGKHLRLRASGFVTVDEQGYKFMYGVYRDLTDEYHLYTRLKSFAENLPGLAFRYCLLPDGSDRITYLKTDADNFDFEGWKGQLVESKNLWDRVHVADVPKLKKEILKLAESLNSFDTEWRSVDKSGKVNWVRGVARPFKDENDVVHWDVLVLNINERKEAEHKRKLVSTKLKLLVNGVEGIVWEADPEILDLTS